MAHGGKREGAGRKAKKDEQKLIERLSPMENLAHEKLKEAVTEGEQWAIKLYFEYMYGRPKQTMDVTTGGEKLTSIKIHEPNDGN